MNQIENYNWVVSKYFNGVRLDYWLKKKIRSSNYPFICKVIRKGYVRVNNKKVSNTSILKSGDLIMLSRKVSIGEVEHIKVPDKKFEKIIKSWIVFKDKNLIVLNKPSGIAVQGGTKIKINIDILLDYLKFENLERPKLVHRLDKDTSGILLIARNLNYAKFLGEKFKSRKIEKKYLAVVNGIPKSQKGCIEIPLQLKNKNSFSTTIYKVLKSSKKHSLVLIKPITGRKHQIRKHFSMIGNIILGENKDFAKEKLGYSNKNLFLHAIQLSYEDIDFKKQTFTADLPEYFVDKVNDMNFELDKILSNGDFFNLSNYKKVKKV